MAAALQMLREEVLKKDEIIIGLDEQIKRQQATIERMEEQMNDLLRRMYGRRSEKLDINQLLMEGMILDADGEATPPSSPPDSEKPPQARKRKANS